MKNILPESILRYILFTSCFAVLFSLNISAQWDDPRVDAIPPDVIQNITYSDSEIDVITIDGYDDFNLGVDFAEPHVVQNPLNPKEYFGAYNINNARRTYDGHDWLGSTPPFPGFVMRGDPVTAYDRNGRLYYENMYGSSSILGCKVIVSTNNGQTWSSPVTAISGFDKNWIAVDQSAGPYSNFLYTIMTRDVSGQNLARSTDLGVTWTQTGTFNTSQLPGSMVAVGPNGSIDGGAVYAVLHNGSNTAATYTFYVSTDGGATWTFKSNQNFANYIGTYVNSRHSVQNMRTRTYPFIAADNSNSVFRGRLYLIYASNDPAGNGNKPDIFCRYSTDQGTTWSSSVKINDDVNTQNNHQWFPSIWCDVATGRLFCKWMDTRDTPTSDSAYIYASYSDNGGVTWATNQRVSNQKMRINCPTCGGGGTPAYQGDYDAIVSLNNQALIMWTDFRQGNFGSYVGYFPDFAMLAYPGNISIPQSGGQEFVTVEIPSVKLYTDLATFTATRSPNPASGDIILDFPNGNTLTGVGTIQLRIQTTGTVTPGIYTVTIQGEGPNGTPVHRRTVLLDVIIPVELTSFTAVSNNNNVVLNWVTATEINNMGFEIERKAQGEFERVGFIEGRGTTSEIQNYSFIDRNVPAGNYQYRLKQVDYNGTTEYSFPVEVSVAPGNYFLGQNYPNPFNPSTTISYSLAKDGNVSLKLYDLLGNEVYSMIDEYKQAGSYEIDFNASNLSSGVYYYQISSGEFVAAKKLMLMK